MVVVFPIPQGELIQVDYKDGLVSKISYNGKEIVNKNMLEIIKRSLPFKLGVSSEIQVIGVLTPNTRIEPLLKTLYDGSTQEAINAFLIGELTLEIMKVDFRAILLKMVNDEKRVFDTKGLQNYLLQSNFQLLQSITVKEVDLETTLEPFRKQDRIMGFIIAPPTYVDFEWRFEPREEKHTGTITNIHVVFDGIGIVMEVVIDSVVKIHYRNLKTFSAYCLTVGQEVVYINGRIITTSKMNMGMVKVSCPVCKKTIHNHIMVCETPDCKANIINFHQAIYNDGLRLKIPDKSLQELTLCGLLHQKTTIFDINPDLSMTILHDEELRRILTTLGRRNKKMSETAFVKIFRNFHGLTPKETKELPPLPWDDQKLSKIKDNRVRNSLMEFNAVFKEFIFKLINRITLT